MEVLFRWEQSGKGVDRSAMSNLQKILIGCGGLVVLSVFFVGCISVLAIVGSDDSGQGDSGPEQPAPQEEPDSQPAPQEEAEAAPAPEEQPEPENPSPEEPRDTPPEETVGIGDPASVGDVAWIVNGARQTQELQSQFGEFGENKQGNFVIVNFAFTNNSSEALTLDTISLVLIDGQEREFEADTDDFEYVNPDKMIFLEQVNPGVTKEGQAIFTVAPDANDFTLRAGDLEFFSDENAFIDLGF